MAQVALVGARVGRRLLACALLPLSPLAAHSHSIRVIAPGSASHYEIQQQQQQESARMNIVLSTAESEKQRPGYQ
jgi:hypothetical protein